MTTASSAAYLPLGSDPQEDVRFYTISAIVSALFLGVGITLSLVNIPEPDREEAGKVPDRYVQFLMKEQRKPPPVTKPEETKPEETKPEETKPEEPKEKPEEKPQESARDAAKRSGLLALSSQLDELKDTAAIDELINESGTQGDGAGEDGLTGGSSSILTAQAGTGSGGIVAGGGGETLSGPRLGKREHTQVKAETKTGQSSTSGQGKRSGSLDSRTVEAIQVVFDQNRGRILSVYNRALRKNPGLQGKIVLELTIEASGSVSKVKILSNELDDPTFVKELIKRVKLFKFEPYGKGRRTITKPLEFLPAS